MNVTWPRLPSALTRLAHSRFLGVIPLVVIALLGLAVMAQFTQYEVGVAGDAVHYMEGARNLLAGKGYVLLRWDGSFKPITTFPPGFSLALAGLGLFGLQPLTAAHYLNVFLFGANIFLVGWIIYRPSRSILFSLLGSLFILTNLNVFKIHSWVMSEGLYIFVTLLALIVLDQYFKTGNRFVLVVTGLLIGYATLVRYLGLAIMMAAYLGVLVFSRKPWKRRGLDMALIGVASLLPVVLWFLRNALVTHNLANRGLVTHSISQLLTVYLNITSSWLFPNDLHLSWRQRLVFFGLFILVTFGIYLYSEYRYSNRQSMDRKATPDPLPGLLALYILIYTIALFINIQFLYIAYDESDIQRYLIPMYVAGILWVFMIYPKLRWSSAGGLIVKGVVFIVSLGLMAVNLSTTLPFIRHPGYAFGYTDVKAVRKDLVWGLKSIDAKRPIITNDYELIYFLSGRPPYAMPMGSTSSQMTADNTDENIKTVQKMLLNGAVLVIIEKSGGNSPVVNALITDLVAWRVYNDVTFFVAPSYVK